MKSVACSVLQKCSVAFNLIYWTYNYIRFTFSERFCLEKCGKIWEIDRFSGRIWPDWGNTAQADMAGLGSIGLIYPLILPERTPCICREDVKILELPTVTTFCDIWLINGLI